jgi:hypothetical protein
MSYTTKNALGVTGKCVSPAMRRELVAGELGHQKTNEPARNQRQPTRGQPVPMTVVCNAGVRREPPHSTISNQDISDRPAAAAPQEEVLKAGPAQHEAAFSLDHVAGRSGEHVLERRLIIARRQLRKTGNGLDRVAGLPAPHLRNLQTLAEDVGIQAATVLYKLRGIRELPPR